MTPTDKQLIPIGPWPKGIDNRSKEESLTTDDKGNVIAARALVNVDIDNHGWATTRKGRTKVFSGTNCHSGFYRRQFPWLLFVDGDTLKATRKDWQPVTIRAGLTPGAPVSYAEVNGEIYWSNGSQNGRITRALEDLPFGLERPNALPTLTASATGGLAAGRYQGACTFLTADAYGQPFEQSGSTLASVIDVPENGGIDWSAIPQPTDSRVVFVRLYVTDTNGDVLREAVDLPIGMTTFSMGNGYRGKALETQFAQPTLPGQIVRYYNGLVLVAKGKFLYRSVPLHYGQTRLSKDFEQEIDTITMVEPVGSADVGGIYVAAAERVWFLRGNFTAKGPIPRMRVHDFGVVPGVSRVVPAKWFRPERTGEAVFFVDTEGVAHLGFPDGTIETHGKVDPIYLAPKGDRGSVLIRELNGMRQVIASMHGTTNKSRASDYVVATVERNGVRV